MRMLYNMNQIVIVDLQNTNKITIMSFYVSLILTDKWGFSFHH